MPSLDKSAPEPDLESARAHVMAIVNGAVMLSQVPTAVSEWPLRPLPPDLRAKLAGRTTGTPPTRDGRHSGQRSPVSVARPAAGLAVVDAVFVVIGFVTGHVALGIGALVLFLLFATLALAARRATPSDAGQRSDQLTGAERRTIAVAGRWTSERRWSGAASVGPERGVVLAAADAAERIGRAPGWRAAVLGGGPMLDVGGELDRIDEEAYRVAMMRAAAEAASKPGGRPAPPAADIEAEWSAVVTRAAALTAYAESLDGLDRQRAASMARDNDALRAGGLLSTGPGDEHVQEALTTLMLWYGLNSGGNA